MIFLLSSFTWYTVPPPPPSPHHCSLEYCTYLQCIFIFLCTGGVPYALFISLLISKLLQQYKVNSLCPAVGGVVSGTKWIYFIPLTTPPPTAYSKEYRIQKLMYIKSPVFYTALGLNDFDEGKSISRAIGSGGPWKSRAKRVPCVPNKVLILGANPPPIAFEMDLPTSKSLRPMPYKWQVH